MVRHLDELLAGIDLQTERRAREVLMSPRLIHRRADTSTIDTANRADLVHSLYSWLHLPQEVAEKLYRTIPISLLRRTARGYTSAPNFPSTVILSLRPEGRLYFFAGIWSEPVSTMFTQNASFAEVIYQHAHDGEKKYLAVRKWRQAYLSKQKHALTLKTPFSHCKSNSPTNIIPILSVDKKWTCLTDALQSRDLATFDEVAEEIACAIQDEPGDSWRARKLQGVLMKRPHSKRAAESTPF